MDKIYFTDGEINIIAQKEDDGYYHLYSIQLGYLDEYTLYGSDNKPIIKRFRKEKVGRKMAKKFLKHYVNNIKKEINQL